MNQLQSTEYISKALNRIVELGIVTQADAIYISQVIDLVTFQLCDYCDAIGHRTEDCPVIEDLDVMLSTLGYSTVWELIKVVSQRYK